MSIDVVLVIVGGSLFVLGITSRISKRILLSPIMLAVAVGAALGPFAAGVLDLSRIGDERTIIEEAARLTLSLVLVDIALRLERRDLRESWQRIARLLAVGMPGMWLMTSLGAWLLLDLPGWVAMLVGAILTPTDPAVASSLVSGSIAEGNIPRPLRRTIQTESGANDGLAIVFVLLAALMLTEPFGRALSHWAWEAVREIGLAVTVGAAIGALAGALVNRLTEHETIEEAYLPLLGVAVGLLTLGAVHLIGGTGVLGSFVAGITLSELIDDDTRRELFEAQEVFVKLAMVPMFVIFGAALPWDDWVRLGWPALVFAVWVLLVRRPVVVPVALAGSATGVRATALLSWFGPLGVTAIYYATAIGQFSLEQEDRIFAVATLAIAMSVVVHAVTATPAVHAYGRAMRAEQDARLP